MLGVHAQFVLLCCLSRSWWWTEMASNSSVQINLCAFVMEQWRQPIQPCVRMASVGARPALKGSLCCSFPPSSLLIPPVTTSVWHILCKSEWSFLHGSCLQRQEKKNGLLIQDSLIYFFSTSPRVPTLCLPLLFFSPVHPLLLSCTHHSLAPLPSSEGNRGKALFPASLLIFSAREQSLTWVTPSVWTRYKLPYGRFN